MGEMPSPYPYQEPDEGDAVRVRYIDINNTSQTAEGEVSEKSSSDNGSWTAIIDAGYTDYNVSYNAENDNYGVHGYGPACEVVVIS